MPAWRQMLKPNNFSLNFLYLTLKMSKCVITYICVKLYYWLYVSFRISVANGLGITRTCVETTFFSQSNFTLRIFFFFEKRWFFSISQQWNVMMSWIGYLNMRFRWLGRQFFLSRCNLLDKFNDWFDRIQ